MKCQKCNKREATTHLTKIVNGYKQEMHLCSECAAQSVEYKDMKSEINSDMNVGISDFLLGLIGGKKKPATATADLDMSANICPTCHMTYSEFLKTGKLGCGDCYTTFGDRLIRPIKQIHGTIEHVGKIPVRGGGDVVTAKKISDLEAKLNAAVLKQDFESAAKLRDEIADLKAGSKNNVSDLNAKTDTGDVSDSDLDDSRKDNKGEEA